MVEAFATLVMNQLTSAGFWETRAYFYMDIVISFLVLLPILSGLSIFFAIRQYLKLHQFTQFLLFILTFLSLSLFAYFVHYLNGFQSLLEESSVEGAKAWAVLVLHIIISIITLVLWFFALMYAMSDKKRRALPGVYSESHAKAGKRVFKSIVLTAFSSVLMYWVLFIA